MSRLRAGLAGLVLAALLWGVFFLWQRLPSRLPLLQALTLPDDSAPYFLAVGRGEDLPSPHLVRSLMGMAKAADVLPAEITPILGFLHRMDRLVLSVTPDPAGPSFCGAFYPVREDLKELSRGALPRLWLERGFLSSAGPGTGRTWQVQFAGRHNLLLRLNGRMLLLAGSLPELQRMEQNLTSSDPPPEPAWLVRPGWSTHLKFHDAGVLADVLFMGGIDVGERILSAEMAWRKGPSAQDLAWKLDGVDDLIATWGFSDPARASRWRTPLTLPSPVLLSLGIDLPAPFRDRFGPGREPGWSSGPGLSVPWEEGLTGGPLVLSLAGRSRLFLFSAPGVYLQLLHRGENARVIVDRLWQGKWSSMRDRRADLEGFPYGGAVSRPFSLVGVAGEDRVVVGLLSPSQVADTKTPDALLPFDPSGSSFWLHGDLPGLAAAVEKWVQLADSARSFGLDISGVEGLLTHTERLRSLGNLSLGLKNPFEGWVSWTGGEDLLP